MGTNPTWRDANWWQRQSAARGVGGALRVLRAELNWSQSALGELLGINHRHVSAIENGYTGISLKLALKFRKHFGLPAELWES